MCLCCSVHIACLCTLSTFLQVIRGQSPPNSWLPLIILLTHVYYLLFYSPSPPSPTLLHSYSPAHLLLCSLLPTHHTLSPSPHLPSTLLISPSPLYTTHTPLSPSPPHTTHTSPSLTHRLICKKCKRFKLQSIFLTGFSSHSIFFLTCFLSFHFSYFTFSVSQFFFLTHFLSHYNFLIFRESVFCYSFSQLLNFHHRFLSGSGHSWNSHIVV